MPLGVDPERPDYFLNTGISLFEDPLGTPRNALT
jgi:hypothetical protein